MADLSKYSLEQLLAEKERRAKAKAGDAATGGEGNEVLSLLSTIGKTKNRSGQAAQAVANAYRVRAGLPRVEPKESSGNKLAETLLTEMVKKRIPEVETRDTNLDRQLKESRIKAIEAGLMTDESGNLIKAPTAIERKAKKAQQGDLINLIETNKPKKEAIREAIEVLPDIPKGLMGSAEMLWKQAFDSENKSVENWQKLKTVLTDAQLLYTAKTKGAISDKEMDLFAKAAANDDWVSVARMKPTLERLLSSLEAEETGAMKSYKYAYGENPEEWFEDTNINIETGLPDNMSSAKQRVKPKITIPGLNGYTVEGAD